jgi:hypothetical protein
MVNFENLTDPVTLSNEVNTAWDTSISTPKPTIRHAWDEGDMALEPNTLVYNWGVIDNIPFNAAQTTHTTNNFLTVGVVAISTTNLKKMCRALDKTIVSESVSNGKLYMPTMQPGKHGNEYWMICTIREKLSNVDNS